MDYLNFEKRKLVRVLKEREIQITEEANKIIESIDEENFFFLNPNLKRQSQKIFDCWKIFK